MEVSIWQALLVGLWAGIAAIDQFNGLTHIHRPIVTGAVIGIILGQPTVGIITGGTLELVWAGMVPLAGAQPPNVVIGGVIGTLFAILSKLSPTTAVGIAVPFSVAVQALITLLFTGMAPVAHAMDVAGLNGETKTIDRMAWIEPAILFVGFFIMGFLPALFGSNVITPMVKAIPLWILGGFQAAGGIMPAVGFGMLLKIMWKVEYAPFFVAGFIAAAYLKMEILPIALLAAAFAAYDYFANQNRKSSGGGTPAPASGPSTDDDDEEDYSNGI
ncbi:PTS sugar transporter subunit IIC [Schleiferilactobacillus shenzhenensis]|uniref:AgaW n=1 Tax=Schleiferilactobacillus shenzhenensis LY-73 TaxID=1231336 RepID=U4TVN4_9LACO|nr:PTS sugar transporter subunit IIC [Schleiferilactobacillus shenzhenensis]ERL65462.1 AgaW [Schleiferilactobacillus shenzhenensis LY-73]